MLKIKLFFILGNYKYSFLKLKLSVIKNLYF